MSYDNKDREDKNKNSTHYDFNFKRMHPFEIYFWLEVNFMCQKNIVEREKK